MCARCGDMKDSDDGCRETNIRPLYSLICIDCMNDEPDENWPGDGTFSAEQQRIIDAHMAEDDGDGP